ncbi:MAG: redoxin domain-containing protein [Planctomycetota bacterium]
MMFRRQGTLVAASLFLSISALAVTARAQVSSSPPSDKPEDLVPKQFLGLVHAPEVYAELNLSPGQIKNLDALFDRVDGDWFRARIYPADAQKARQSKVEAVVRQWFKSNASAAQVKRLKQLEHRSQGIRMLLTPEIRQQLSLNASQVSELVELAKAANEATAKLQQATMKNAVTEELKSAVVKAAQAEQGALQSVLKPEQVQQLGAILGKPFDTTKLKRIYPKAPELVPVDEWINSSGLTLRELRGKVVLVHFYAFQCHNCHANFDHYRRWHDKYGDDVVVIGIQTPETPSERDPAAVRSAAQKRQLEFPILVDLESKNWKSWSNTMWPTVYVIDKKGYIRHWWQGELNWNGATGDKTIEDLVADLLKEKSDV